jgi:hypothetical protein
MVTPRVEVISGKKIERLGTVKAPDQRTAYARALPKGGLAQRAVREAGATVSRTAIGAGGGCDSPAR